MKYSRWIVANRRNPAAAIRLFCFPYAGSGASIFRDWQDHLPGEVEVIGMQLPGRENRFSETRFSRLEDVIAPLLELMAEMSDKPFYFFGHSVGALISFELTRALQRNGLKLPFHLVASGMRAPQLPRHGDPHYLMDDDTLLEEIKNFNGTPEDLLQEIELMKFFLPQLRDDFSIAETYEYIAGRPLRCPIMALGSDSDPNVAEADVASWSANTIGEFQYHIFQGNHFFIHPNKKAVLELLGQVAMDNMRERQLEPKN